jgi:hypothetical protein
MSSQRRFAPIGGRFEPEQVAGLAGIYTYALLSSFLIEEVKNTQTVALENAARPNELETRRPPTGMKGGDNDFENA